MLNVNLDDKAEKYLVEILAQEKTTSTELIKHLLHEHWQSLQPRKSILEGMGGYPEHLLQSPFDKDFDIYRRYRRQPFERVFLPQ